MKITNHLVEAPTMIEGLLRELVEWGGVDRDVIMHHLVDMKDATFS